MRRLLLVGLAIVSLVAASIGMGTAAPTVDTLRFVWYTNGSDLPAIQALVSVYNSQNPDTKVELSVVPFANLDTLLTTQASAGQAPDLARVTAPYLYDNYALDLRPYFQDKSFAKQFLPGAMSLTTLPSGAVFGFPHDLTMNGPFINLTLVKKAGLALPKGDKVPWATWMDLATKVAKAAGVPYAAALDRSGHRLDGFIQSYGGGYFTPDGKGVRDQQSGEPAGDQLLRRCEQERGHAARSLGGRGVRVRRCAAAVRESATRVLHLGQLADVVLPGHDRQQV